MDDVQLHGDNSPPPIEIGYPCRITARFEHSGIFDDIALRLGVQQDHEWARSVGGRRLRGCPAEATVYLSSPFCPFEDYVHFLEDVVYGKSKDCGFEWDAEGPTGRLHWYSSADPSVGTLSVRWTARRSTGLRRYLVLDRRQMVAALYGGFRAFVEGPDYVALRYEAASRHRQFELALGPSNVDKALEYLARSTAIAVRAALARIDEATRPPVGKRTRRLTLADLMFGNAVLRNSDPEGSCFGLDPHNWDRASQSCRWKAMHKAIEWREGTGFGRNLDALRSPVIEHWLREGDVRLPFNYDRIHGLSTSSTGCCNK